MAFAVSMPENEAFENGVSGPLVGLLTTFKAIVGAFHMEDYQNTLSLASFLFFLFLNVIVMLNLLIAIMSDSYEKVKDGEVVEALKLRAETIISEEAMMSETEWAKIEFFPRYLEVMQATEPPEIVWSGVSGQISNLDAKTFELIDGFLARRADLDPAARADLERSLIEALSARMDVTVPAGKESDFLAALARALRARMQA